MRRKKSIVRLVVLTGALALAAAVGGCRFRSAGPDASTVSRAAAEAGTGLAGLGGVAAGLAAPVMAAGMRGVF
ncbi:MAG: hypothetical protein LIQ30_09300, partial [Planctomycetes bacterium]|nr:hypothetical protein [Planctomycetota bacterium]